MINVRDTDAINKAVEDKDYLVLLPLVPEIMYEYDSMQKVHRALREGGYGPQVCQAYIKPVLAGFWSNSERAWNIWHAKRDRLVHGFKANAMNLEVPREKFDILKEVVEFVVDRQISHLHSDLVNFCLPGMIDAAEKLETPAERAEAYVTTETYARQLGFYDLTRKATQGVKQNTVEGDVSAIRPKSPIGGAGGAEVIPPPL